MKEILQPTNPFFSFMSKVGDMILLNLLTIFCCIPIITSGAAVCSLYRMVRLILENKETYIIRDYFRYFKENLKNSFILSTLFLFLGLCFLFSGFSLFSTGKLTYSSIPYFLLLLLYLTSIIYTFPLQATFINTPFHILKNSLLTALSHLPETLLLFAITYIPVSLTLLLPEIFYITFLYWLLIGFSFSELLASIILHHIFLQYMPVK